MPLPVSVAGVTGPRTCVACAVGVQSSPSQGQARVGHVYASTAGSLVVHQSDVTQSGRAASSDGDGTTLSIGIGVTSELVLCTWALSPWTSSYAGPQVLSLQGLCCIQHWGAVSIRESWIVCLQPGAGPQWASSLGGLPLTLQPQLQCSASLSDAWLCTECALWQQWQQETATHTLEAMYQAGQPSQEP